MEDFIVIDGVKYKVDPNDKTKPLLDDKGEKVLYVEDKKGGEKVDLSKFSLEELKKANPDVAKALLEAEQIKADKAKADAEKEEAERKAKADQGKWQELAEEETKKRKEAEAQSAKDKDILDKYKGTVNGILEETLKSIPEDKRGLIPSDYSPRKKLEYINSNAKTLGITIGGVKGGAIPPHEVDVNLDDESKAQKEYDELLKKGSARTPIENDQMLALAKKIKEIRLANADKKKV